MYTVIVSISVAPGHVESFKAASLDNARQTRLEDGNLRFDLIQHEDDPARFTIYEVYRLREDFVAHQKTAHYLRWRDAVAGWMAQPRTAVKGTPIFFGDGE
jgi:(4S)-4-hydroxy-5-phosphonooxypentane-2,3-dione isomerase